VLNGGPDDQAILHLSACHLGTVMNTLVVTLSEDAYEGDAEAAIGINGMLLTATPITVTAERGAGDTQTFTFQGNFGPQPQGLAISFLNDAYGGLPSLDRNLYVDGITFDGQLLLGGGSVALYTTSTDHFVFPDGGNSVVTQGGIFGSGPDTLTVALSEDSFEGDALANISLDGTLLTRDPIAVTASHSADDREVFTFQGDFGLGPHTVAVSFLNDAYGGSPSLDRNLYVDGITLDGQASPDLTGTGVALYTTGTDNFVTGNTTDIQQGVSFGPDQYVSAGDILQYDSGQSWSVATLVEIDAPAPGPSPPDLPQGGADVIFGNTNGTPYTGYEMWIDDSGHIRVRIMSDFINDSYIDVVGSANVADGKMHFIGASYDGSSKAAGVQLYVDGAPQQVSILSDTLTGSSASNGPMIIGNQLNGWEDQFELRGAMFDLALSNVARPESYFQPNNAEAPPIDSSTQLEYNFDAGSGLVVSDLSGNNNNGTLSSATMWSALATS
jgi:Ca-dependent carbohydrate-binding module xylan-binding